MDENKLSVQNNMMMQRAVSEIEKCSEIAVRYGIAITKEQSALLAAHRFKALRDMGRMEFGKGVMELLMYEFCDSKYIGPNEFVDTIIELQDSFYYFKNESLDQIPDDELVKLMKEYFDGECQGSLEYLNGTSLEYLCRRARYGYS